MHRIPLLTLCKGLRDLSSTGTGDGIGYEAMSQAVSAAKCSRLPLVTTDRLDPDGSSALGLLDPAGVMSPESTDRLDPDGSSALGLIDPAGVASLESAACAPVGIDLLSPGEWPALRSARLAALRDSPEAFVAILAVEEKRASEEWVASLTSSFWVVARNDGAVVGIACLAAKDLAAPEKRFIESVWVDPRYRGQNGRRKLNSPQSLVRQMLHKLEWCARAEGAKRLQLWVLRDNESAIDAYLKLGFDPVPDSEQDSPKLQSDGTFVQERLMIKPLF